MNLLDPNDAGALEDLEVFLLLEAIFRRTGFDFREYSSGSLRRRIVARVQAEGLKSVSALLDRVLHDDESMEKTILSMSVSVTSMFRDPGFYVAFRTHVIPLLRTYPFARIWHAGCATGAGLNI